MRPQVSQEAIPIVLVGGTKPMAAVDIPIARIVLRGLLFSNGEWLLDK